LEGGEDVDGGGFGFGDVVEAEVWVVINAKRPATSSVVAGQNSQL
jgi:hypothetical protein